MHSINGITIGLLIIDCDDWQNKNINFVWIGRKEIIDPDSYVYI